MCHMLSFVVLCSCGSVVNSITVHDSLLIQHNVKQQRLADILNADILNVIFVLA